MRRRLPRPSAWPVTLKVPLIVVALMVAIGTLLSQEVLRRLEESQRTNLQALTGAYLDGLSASLLPSVLRDDVWEIFDALERARGRYQGLNPVNTLVLSRDGLILAASDPRAFRTRNPLPDELLSHLPAGEGLRLDPERGQAYARRLLVYQSREIGEIIAQLDIAELLAERRQVLAALIASNAGITLLLALIGYLLVRRTMRPIAVLAEHLEKSRGGPLVPVPPAAIGDRRSEFGRLFRRFNALVRAVNEREALAQQLAEEERLAALGRLASGMAHEINNPLGGLQTLVDTLRTHGDDPKVRQEALALVDRGLKGIRDVVRSTLVTYKGPGDAAGLTRSDLDDLRYLVKHEVARRQLRLLWQNDLPERVALPGGMVRQAVLNLLLNACAATPLGGRVTLEASATADGVVIALADEGAGLPPEMRALLTSRERLLPVPRGSGLGLWMVARLLRDLGGTAEVEDRPEGGTRIALLLPLQREERKVQHVA